MTIILSCTIDVQSSNFRQNLHSVSRGNGAFIHYPGNRFPLWPHFFNHPFQPARFQDPRYYAPRYSNSNTHFSDCNVLFGCSNASCPVYLNSNYQAPIGLKALKEKWPEHFSKPTVNKNDICKLSEKAALRKAEIFGKKDINSTESAVTVTNSSVSAVTVTNALCSSQNEPEVMIVESNSNNSTSEEKS